MPAWSNDIRYSLRRPSKSGFVAAVVLSIALGIAANATIFSMISRFVVRTAPVGNPSTLLGIHTTHDGGQCCNNFPYPVYTDVRDRTKSLPAAWAAAKFSESFLYGIRPHDAATFTLVPLFLALVAAAACWIPARRASRADLNTSLRSE